MIKPKGYYIKKRIDRPAKLVGLNYNTFFVFVIIATIVVMGASLKGIPGFLVGVVLVFIIYLVLFTIQTKLGPREVAKLLKNYYAPIHHIKIRKSFKNKGYGF